MPIFKQQNNSLQAIREVKLEFEKDLQSVAEKNLESVFGLQFVASEFRLNNLRIDTLAFDPETNAFVIIEFKRDKSFSVVDQGFAYLALMLNNKSDFILEYNEKMHQSLKREDVDWSQSRVLFVAHSFTQHQRQAINFKDLPIELWEVRKYENDILSFNLLKAINTAESIKTVTKDESISQVSKEVHTYTLEDHLKESWPTSSELYAEFDERLNEVDSRFEQKINKHYIAYRIDGKNICEVVVQKQGLKVHFDAPLKVYNDPENKLEDCSQKGHWATGDTKMSVASAEDISDAILFVKKTIAHLLAE